VRRDASLFISGVSGDWNVDIHIRPFPSSLCLARGLASNFQYFIRFPAGSRDPKVFPSISRQLPSLALQPQPTGPPAEQNEKFATFDKLIARSDCRRRYLAV